MEDLDSDEILTNGHAGMLNDHHRHLAYKSSIRGAITTIHKTHKTVRLLDIGAGTGLLSLYAAQAGAEVVVACESNSTMCTVARQTIKRNFEECSTDVEIRIEECSSEQLDQNPEYRNSFNIIVSEIYDSSLVGEGCIPTYRHALQKLASPDCIFIPQQATLYAQPVFSERLKSLYFYSDHNNIQDPSDNPSSNSRYLLYEEPFEAHLDKIPDLKLGPKTNIWEWNFNKASMDTWTGSKTHKIGIRNDHTDCIGVLVWWSSHIDSENIITLAPNGTEGFQEFRDHWMPLMYFMCPQTSDFSINISVTEVDIKLSHVDPTDCTCSPNSDINLNPRSIGMMNSSRLNQPLDYPEYDVTFEDPSNSAKAGRTTVQGFYDPFCLTSLSYFNKHLHLTSQLGLKETQFIKRPMNAFMVWSQIQIAKIVKEKPSMHNAAISKQLGTAWKQLSPDERLPYIIESQRLKRVHKQQYPDYKYRPKKRSKLTKEDGSVSPCDLVKKPEIDLTVILIDSPQIYNKFVPPSSIDGFTISCYQEQVKRCLRNLRGEDLVEPIYLWEYDYRVISDKLSIGKLLKTSKSEELTLLFRVKRDDCRLTNIIFSLNYWGSDKGFEDELYHKVDCYTNVDQLELMRGDEVSVRIKLEGRAIRSIDVFKV